MRRKTKTIVDYTTRQYRLRLVEAGYGCPGGRIIHLLLSRPYNGAHGRLDVGLLHSIHEPFFGNKVIKINAGVVAIKSSRRCIVFGRLLAGRDEVARSNNRRDRF